MTRSVELNNFTDFDRLLIGKNFIITILGAISAFSLAYFRVLFPIPYAPHVLSFSVMIMMVVTIYTANIGSALLVALVGSIGLIGADGEYAPFILVYIWINVLAMITLGFLSDRLRLVSYWNKFYLLMAFLFSVFSIAVGIFWNSIAGDYWDNGFKVGNGGDAGTGIGLPVLDAGIILGILILLLITAFAVKGQVQLNSSSTIKYKIFGALFFLMGQAITFVPVVLFSVNMNSSDFAEIRSDVDPLLIIDDLLTHSEGKYTIYGDPISVFFVMALTVAFTAIGIVLWRIGQYSGNMEGAKGGSNVIFFAPPIGIILYFLLASYQLQNIIAPGGLYIPMEFFGLFASMIWIVWSVNALIGRIILLFLDRF